MKTVLLIGFLTCLSPLTATNLQLNGLVGKYPVEIILTDSDWSEGKLSGKYRYTSKSKYLKLTGKILGNCIYLVEVYNNDTTGSFYLEKKEDSITGKWIGKTSFLAVSLYIQAGDQSLLESKTLNDYASKVSKRISGTYQNEYYFLNDMWLSEKSLEMEIAFNGGRAIIDSICPDSIKFQVSVVCGPTYHIAYAQGIAVKQKGDRLYTYVMAGSENKAPCVIDITLEDKVVRFEASGGFSCEFGARAFLSHTFLKTSEKIDFDEDF